MNHSASPTLGSPASTYQAGLFWFALFTALATLGLVGMGGLVTSHGVGMAVPDWPTSYGYNMFALPLSTWLTGGIFHEHTHRLWASEVGILIVVLNCWLFGKKSRPLVRWLGVLLIVVGLAGLHRPNGLQASIHIGIHGVAMLAASFFWPRDEAAAKHLRRLGVIAFVAVLLQGLLGGLRVVWDAQIVADVRLGTAFGILHGCLGQGFLVLTAVLALLTSRWWLERQQNQQERAKAGEGNVLIRRWFLFATILISAQLLIAATMRHQHAGLAIPDFPLAHGKLWPDLSAEAVARYNMQRVEVTTAQPITAFQITLQMVHRIVALFIVVAVAVCAGKTSAGTSLRRLAKVWVGLILGQIALGAWTVWSNKAADVATAHVVVGALSLVTGALGCLISFRRLPETQAGAAPVISSKDAMACRITA
jgi:heme a synthase